MAALAAKSDLMEETENKAPDTSIAVASKWEETAVANGGDKASEMTR